MTTLLNSELTNSEIPGYSWVERESNYGGIRQRWLVVKSEARTESDLTSLEKKITKESESIQKKLTQLFQKRFKSETEAELNLKLIQSQLKFHVIDEVQITENQEQTYQITGVIQTNNDVIEAYKNRAVRFIIATNRLDSESFTCDEMLIKYKEQQNVERGFAVLVRVPLLGERSLETCVVAGSLRLRPTRGRTTSSKTHCFLLIVYS